MNGSARPGCFAVLLVGLLLLVIFPLIAPYYATQIWWALREGLFWMIPIVILLALGAFAAMAFDEGNSSAGVGASLLTFAGFVVFIGWCFVHEYQQERVYAATIHITTDPVPALNQRTPFNVSAAQVRSNLGDIPGDVQQTTYLPDLKQFTTPVERRGSFTGYQTLLVQDINETGRNTATRCDFGPAADRRFGGMFSHSLARLINDNQRFVNWDAQDVFGYCDHGHPQIVVPLKEQDGWVVVTERPAGLAVYDGATGALSIHSDARGIPGPTYPLSLAATQRESAGVINGFSDWWWSRAGWELPDDTNEINSGNIAEFVLATPQGQGQYVTLLTGRGSATAISAISTASAHLGQGNALQPLMVHRTNPGWLSPAAILDRIHADFGDVFATQRNAQIFEIAPRGGNQWTATIGLPQNLLYRVHGLGDLSQPLCLVHLDDQPIRCGPAVGVNGSGFGVAIGGATGTGSVTAVPANSDLGALSNQQLFDLISRANAEAARRAEVGGH